MNRRQLIQIFVYVHAEIKLFTCQQEKRKSTEK